LRGAGNLLGPEQTGHIRQIGLDLYRNMLHRALSQARGGKPENEIVTLRLGIPAAIPADYVSDPESRINLYARLARLKEAAEIDRFADELEDRFGPLPLAARNLLDSAQVATVAAGRLGIIQIDAGPVGVGFTFGSGLADPVRRRAEKIGSARWDGSRAVFQRPSNESDRLKVLAELVEQLSSDQEHAPGAT
jgi:transcription-repair coupling factor (superfamily II helicase)